ERDVLGSDREPPRDGLAQVGGRGTGVRRIAPRVRKGADEGLQRRGSGAERVLVAVDVDRAGVGWRGPESAAPEAAAPRGERGLAAGGAYERGRDERGRSEPQGRQECASGMRHGVLLRGWREPGVPRSI